MWFLWPIGFFRNSGVCWPYISESYKFPSVTDFQFQFMALDNIVSILLNLLKLVSWLNMIYPIECFTCTWECIYCWLECSVSVMFDWFIVLFTSSFSLLNFCLAVLSILSQILKSDSFSFVCLEKWLFFWMIFLMGMEFCVTSFFLIVLQDTVPLSSPLYYFYSEFYQFNFFLHVMCLIFPSLSVFILSLLLINLFIVCWI